LILGIYVLLSLAKYGVVSEGEEGLKPQRKSAIAGRLVDGLWIKCENCGEIIFRRELQKNFSVCQKCRYHFRINSREYIEILIDPGSFREFNTDLISADPLKFKDTKRYPDRIQKAVKETGINEAVRTGVGQIDGRPD